MTKILMTGVTGYIGGAVLTRFAQRPDFESFEIHCIVRSPEKAEKIKALFKNVKPIVGSHSDIPLMTEAVSKVDIVIAMADCDDVDAATGTLQGLRKRLEGTGKQPIFINTSGTGVLSDKAAGMNPTETIWNDADSDQMATLAPTQMHRNVDLMVVGADVEGYTKTYIILPATIWGIATGPLFDSGISNKQSQQIPALIGASLDRGHAGMVGLGKNIWPNVEIHELADLYSILFDAVLSPTANPGHGLDGYYFGADQEHTLYQIGTAISDALHKAGKSKGGQPTTFTKQELDKYFNGSDYLGSNSRCRANRSKSLGWAPKKTTRDMLDSIYPEMELIASK
ncbi:NAD(P)-binding protein [Rhodocollybia butyracea]|uniref:NAD(P)-binding protein n=1 Tax=Rhodocollybia butyracea TaxID=206335 RepID=A0A9P5PNP6_9AGAR|nr:NAD(P)-binding protein [Rhodocollybia butyracea]